MACVRPECEWRTALTRCQTPTVSDCANSNVRFTDRAPTGRVRWWTPRGIVSNWPGLSSSDPLSNSVESCPSITRNVSSEFGMKMPVIGSCHCGNPNNMVIDLSNWMVVVSEMGRRLRLQGDDLGKVSIHCQILAFPIFALY